MAAEKSGEETCFIGTVKHKVTSKIFRVLTNFQRDPTVLLTTPTDPLNSSSFHIESAVLCAAEVRGNVIRFPFGGERNEDSK